MILPFSRFWTGAIRGLHPNKDQVHVWNKFTSQCSGEQEVGAIFSDDVVSDGTETGSPAQLPNGLQELWVQRQGKAIVLWSLQGQTVHLPSAKLPAMYVT